MMGCKVNERAVKAVDGNVVCLAKPRDGLGNRIEDGLNIMRRSRDDSQDFGSGTEGSGQCEPATLPNRAYSFLANSFGRRFWHSAY
jgi:hypothetical protein